jgi:pSer/pThr/pTyr-binding forkhead associated (FHA) protein
VLSQPFALVGRDPTMDVHCDDHQVSKRHAYLQVLAGRVFCIDLRSRTGTHWNHGNSRWGWLGPSETVRIGAFLLRLRELTPRPCSRIPRGLPEVRLEFCNETRLPWRMRGPLALVGSASECTVRLPGPQIALFHCSLVRTPAGVWVIDLLGNGDVEVNGQEVRCAPLRDGDQLRVGRFLLRFVKELARHHQESELRSQETGVSSQEFSGHGEEFPLSANPPVMMPPPGDGLTLLPAPPVPVTLDATMQRQLLEPLLFPLVNQFALMQQQMMDQFQQAILGMAQMFTSLQRDQMVLIREELQHLRAVTQELHDLQTRAALQPAPAANGSPAKGKSEGPPQRGDSQIAPEPPTAPPARKPFRARPTKAPEPPEPPVEPAASPPAEPAPAPVVAAKLPEEPVPPAPAAGRERQGSAEIHDWLTKRIESLQRERQSRWQKIMGFLTGKRS